MGVDFPQEEEIEEEEVAVVEGEVILLNKRKIKINRLLVTLLSLIQWSRVKMIHETTREEVKEEAKEEVNLKMVMSGLK